MRSFFFGLQTNIMNNREYKFGSLHLRIAKDVSDYAGKVISDTEDLITNVIPDKVVLLEKLSREEVLPYDDISSITKDLVLPTDTSYNFLMRKGKDNIGILNGYGHTGDNTNDNTKDEKAVVFQPIACNSKLTRLIDIIKPEVKDVIDICEKISLWILLLIPKIEDGNNFGVEIQQEILCDVRRIQEESLAFLSEMSMYFINRAQMASKVTKYPFLEDYKRALKEVDEEEYLKLRAMMNTMRSNYVVVLAVVSKNYEKIKAPRSQNNVESMY